MNQGSAPTEKSLIPFWSLLATILLALQAIVVWVSAQGQFRLLWNSVMLFVVLAVATWVSTQNALGSRSAIRLFWAFVASGSGLWAMNAVLAVLYAVGWRESLPYPTLSASGLFLQTAVMLAAATVRPHVKQLQQRLYGTASNCVLVLLFWAFLYVYFLVPSQYPNWDPATASWFAILYFVENAVLMLVAVTLVTRTKNLWRSVYRALFGTSLLYAFCSLAANWRGAHNVYFSGLLDILRTGGAWILVWLAIFGRESAPQLAQAAGPGRKSRYYPNIPAIVVLSALPVFGLWELLRANESESVHTIRVFAVLIASLLTLTVLFTEYLVDASQLKRAEEALHESEEEFNLAFEAARLGWWIWNEETGHLILSEGTRAVLGLPSEAEITLHTFLNTVDPDDRERVYQTWLQSLERRTYYFVEYRVLWPDGTIHWVEARGRTYGGLRGKSLQMVGVSMDITERKRAEEALRALGGRLIEAQEQERIRIARELHDDFCQRLAILGIELQRLKNEPELSEAGLQKLADHLAGFTEEIASDLQALSHELHSSKLEILGTTAAMKSFCAEFADQHHVQIEFTSRNVPLPLSREVSVCLYRILQEALRNAVKHSRARHFFVAWRGEHEAVELTVRDLGVGFNVETAAQGRGLGLLSMRERINLVKGTISIESVPGSGTTIRARVPVEEMTLLRSA